MEHFTHTAPSTPIAWPASKKWSLSGVVGSGNLEVLLEPHPTAPQKVSYDIATSVAGYRESWVAGLDDFAHHYAVGGVKITIHDQGAPPVVIMMRLRQALDNLTQP
jgi:malonate decarboxylase acyl carrier protein